MKTIRDAGLMWVMLSLMVLVTSCGVSVSPEGLADEAIKEAERLAPEDNNLAFPEIGSLYHQEKEAYKCLDRLLREENSSLAKNSDGRVPFAELDIVTSQPLFLIRGNLH